MLLFPSTTTLYAYNETVLFFEMLEAKHFRLGMSVFWRKKEKNLKVQND